MRPDSTYTHGHHESVLRSHRWRTAENSAAYLLPYLTSDTTLLDVGAGPGTITADFAAIVAQVTATEVGEAELDLARATLTERWLGNVDFEVADVHDLPFDDDSFDVSHAHQVLQHVDDPVLALRELARVTRPGGIVALRDSDYGAFTWWPRIPALDEWLTLYEQCARSNGGEPNAGRRLLAWANAAGLRDTVPTSSTWCYATPGDRAWWGGMWADRILTSAMAEQAVKDGLATREDLQRISDGWLEWAAADDGWLSLLHGELIIRV